MLSRVVMINNKVSLIASLKSESLRVLVRTLSTQPAPAFKDPEWDTARPYDQIPTQSWRDFLPGGDFYNVEIDKIHEKIHKKYGPLVRLPGFLGRKELIVSYVPEDFEKVYRTEGKWPYRLNLDTLSYWRSNVRKDIFTKFRGLVEEHGEAWQKYRTIINPVLMQPKTVGLYVPKIDEVARDLIELTRVSRDAEGTTPADFGTYCQRYALESIGLVALDRRLDVLAPKEDNRGTILATAVDTMFTLSYQLDVLPSIWRYVKTPKFVKLMKTLDQVAGIVMAMVEESVKELEANPSQKSPEEQSVLEKLLKIDKDVAIIMAFDMLVVGIDTTSSSIKSMLYLLAKNPEKQEKLRQEILTILPQKDTPLTTDAMKHLPYLRACMKEQHRVMPVVNGNARAAGENIVVQGYRIPKGTDILLTHGLPTVYANQYGRAMEFIPERWLKDETAVAAENCPHAKTAHPFTYMPFGFGNRACIGKRFADLETAVITARMVRNFEMSWNQPEPKMQMAVVNSIVSDMKLTLKDV